MASYTVESLFRVLEERLVMPGTAESRESLGALLAPAFREVGSSRRITTDVSAVRSSLWVKREGRWQLLFHQGTRVSESGS